MYNYDKNFFETIDSEEKAYWAGFIAADGNVRKDFKKMRIDLNIQDKPHLVKFRESMKANVPIVENIRPKNHSCYIDINCTKLCKDLNKLGVTPKKSLTLDIDFNQIPEDLIHHFIRGYFDGDGSLNVYFRNGDEWELSFIGTEIFLYKILSYFKMDRNLYTCGNNFRFCFKKKQDILNVLNYIYKDATIYLDRKYEKVQQFCALNDYQVATLNG